MLPLNPSSEPLPLDPAPTPAPDHDRRPDREPLEVGIPQRGTLKREVWNVVSTHGPIRTPNIAKMLNKPAPSVRSALQRLEHESLIVRVQMNTWELA